MSKCAAARRLALSVVTPLPWKAAHRFGYLFSGFPLGMHIRVPLSQFWVAGHLVGEDCWAWADQPQPISAARQTKASTLAIKLLRSRTLRFMTRIGTGAGREAARRLLSFTDVSGQLLDETVDAPWFTKPASRSGSEVKHDQFLGRLNRPQW